MTPPKAESIIIIGGGTAGWLSALALSRFSLEQKRNFKITVIEPEEIPTIGVGEATVDSYIGFIEGQGVDLFDMIHKTGASFKQAIRFKHWRGLGEEYWHPFYERSLRHDLLFESLNTAGEFSDLFLNTALARKNKSPYRGANRVASGIHFDNFKMAIYLRQHCLSRGVELVREKVVDFELTSNGHVKSVTLSQGRSETADYFLDCSGFQSILLGRKLQSPYADFSEYLLNNRALAFQVPYGSDKSRLAPYTTAWALSSGWSWIIPLQERVGTGYVFSDNHLSAIQAEQEMRQTFSIPSGIEARSISIRVGHYKEIFKGNCMGVGLSTGFIEPLESSGIMFITSALEGFLKYLSGEISQEQLNKTMAQSYVATRDFLFLHYKFSQRTDTSYWRDVRQLPFPVTLTEKMERLEEMKHKPATTETIKFLEQAFKPWDIRSVLCVLVGLGFFPKVDETHPHQALIERAKLKIDLESDLFTDNVTFLEGLA